MDILIFRATDTHYCDCYRNLTSDKGRTEWRSVWWCLLQVFLANDVVGRYECRVVYFLVGPNFSSVADMISLVARYMTTRGWDNYHDYFPLRWRLQGVVRYSDSGSSVYAVVSFQAIVISQLYLGGVVLLYLYLYILSLNQISNISKNPKIAEKNDSQ